MTAGADAGFRKLLEPILERLHLELDAEQWQLMNRHFDLLLKWNARINLTSIGDPAEIVMKHFGESLFLANAVRLAGASLVDIGSGAGFPGLPVAVLDRSANVTLVESIAKKAAFLKEAGRGIANLSVVHGRFENLRGHYDWATLRGVSLQRILPSIFKSADHLAILTASSKAGELTSISGVEWQSPLHVPWADTVLLTGTVPRGTREGAGGKSNCDRESEGWRR